MAPGLRERAERILACPAGEGAFTPTPPPALLTFITDEVLVMAADAVAAAAAKAQPQPSGKAQLRLLACVVADAHGADIPLQKPLAETVGKRLDRQARSVRATTEAAVQHAKNARAAVSDGADWDGGPGEVRALRAALAKIDEEAAAALARSREEIYVGFHELESLVPGGSGYLPAETVWAREALDASVEAVESPTGVFARVRFPWRIDPETWREEDGSVPPDLVQALGSDGTQALVARVPPGLIGDEWWSIGMPSLVMRLLDQARVEEEYHTGMIDLEIEDRKEARAELKLVLKDLEDAEDEIERLDKKLERAKGREEALLEVISRCRWGEEAEKVSVKRPRGD